MPAVTWVQLLGQTRSWSTRKSRDHSVRAQGGLHRDAKLCCLQWTLDFTQSRNDSDQNFETMVLADSFPFWWYLCLAKPFSKVVTLFLCSPPALHSCRIWVSTPAPHPESNDHEAAGPVPVWHCSLTTSDPGNASRDPISWVEVGRVWAGIQVLLVEIRWNITYTQAVSYSEILWFSSRMSLTSMSVEILTSRLISNSHSLLSELLITWHIFYVMPRKEYKL